jgi:hypothetical protein
MATVYIKSDTGSTGSGTSGDPYYFDELSAARTAAGSTGTIIYKDGTYTVTTQYNALVAGEELHKAENTHKAIFSMEGSTAYFKSIQLEGIKLVGDSVYKTYLFNAGTDDSANNTFMTDCIIDYRLCGVGQLFRSGTCQLRNVTSEVWWVGQLVFYDFGAGSFVENCTFRFTADGDTGAFQLQFEQFDALCYSAVNCDWKNVIVSVGTTANTAISWGASNAFGSSIKNCCFYAEDGDFGAADSSGVDENIIYTDPQFVDVDNFNFNLRPNSPCLGAGTL